jgi:hypothetical protein
MGLHKPIAYLNKLVKQNLIIVDGLNGDLNFEEGGNPIHVILQIKFGSIFQNKLALNPT